MGWDSVGVLVGLGAAVAACVTDVRSRRIPNGLTYGALGIAALLAVAASVDIGAQTPLWQAGGGFVACGLPFLVAFIAGGCGGGDVKLMAALGALLGFPLAVDHLVWTLISGAAVAVALIVLRGELLFHVRRFYLALADRSIARGPVAATPSDQSAAIPFAVPALLGMAIVAVLHFGGYQLHWWAR